MHSGYVGKSYLLRNSQLCYSIQLTTLWNFISFPVKVKKKYESKIKTKQILLAKELVITKSTLIIIIVNFVKSKTFWV